MEQMFTKNLSNFNFKNFLSYIVFIDNYRNFGM